MVVKCPICKKEFKQITISHLKTHDILPKDFKKKFPNANRGLSGEENNYAKKHGKKYPFKKKCLQCKKDILITKYNRKKVFCNHSCSAKYHNKKRPKKRCLNCNVEFRPKTRMGIFCSHFCYKEYKNKQSISWESIRKKSLKRYNNKCHFCDWSLTLDIHHIDGNSTNNKKENLIVLCPNHHMAIHRAHKTIEELKNLKL